MTIKTYTKERPLETLIIGYSWSFIILLTYTFPKGSYMSIYKILVFFMNEISPAWYSYMSDGD